MEKYRKWTDEATGINPFITAQKQRQSLLPVMVGVSVAFVKFLLFVGFLPILLFLLILPIRSAKKIILQVYTVLFGMYSIDDHNFTSTSAKKAGHIILSNHSCFLDVFYFLLRFPSSKFIVMSAGSCRLIGPITAIFRILTKTQAFYEKNPAKNAMPFSKLMKEQRASIERGQKIVLFYEQIRTNGLGTANISRELAEEVFNSGCNICFTHLKHTPSKQSLLLLVGGPLWPLFAALSTLVPENRLRVRALFQGTAIIIQKTNKFTQLMNSSKRQETSLPVTELKQYILLIQLETKPTAFQEFIYFYNRTKRGQYVA